MCTKYFLQINLCGKKCWNYDLYNTSIEAYVTVWDNKTSVTHQRILRIVWKIENKLMLSISAELCHKNSMLGSQNGPLIITNNCDGSEIIAAFSWWWLMMILLTTICEKKKNVCAKIIKKLIKKILFCLSCNTCWRGGVQFCVILYKQLQLKSRTCHTFFSYQRNFGRNL